MKPLLSKVAVVLTLLASQIASDAVAQPKRPPAPVVVAKVAKSRQTGSMTFIGTVTPIRISTIGSAVDGRVIMVHAEEGDLVSNESTDEDTETKGQPLVQLRTGTLQIQIDAAQVELEYRRQSLLELEKSIPIETEQLAAAVQQIQAELDFAQIDFERMDKLHKEGGLSKKERDEAFSVYQSQSQKIIVARALLNRLTNTAEAKLAQSRAQVKAQEEEIRRLEDLKTKYTIRAPFEGYVVAKMAEVGQWISQGEDVMQVVQVDPIEVTINVPQGSIQKLQSALDASRAANEPLMAQIQIDGIRQLLDGEVKSIVPQADLRSRSFPVKIRLQNPKTAAGYVLKPGMLARASLLVGDESEVLFVKKDALVLGDNETKLFVVSTQRGSEQTIARQVTVDIGAAVKDWIQVNGLLDENDVVVVEGNERLQPGQEIRVVKTLEDTIPTAGSN